MQLLPGCLKYVRHGSYVAFGKLLPLKRYRCKSATPARCGHSGRLHASDSPVLCVGGGLVGLTAVATRAHELFWTRVCR